MLTVSEIKWLVTHSGRFHADEVMASVILTKVFPAAEIRRTRAADWITPASDRVIYDVGGAYDASARIFDHHQQVITGKATGRVTAPYAGCVS